MPAREYCIYCLGPKGENKMCNTPERQVCISCLSPNKRSNKFAGEDLKVSRMSHSSIVGITKTLHIVNTLRRNNEFITPLLQNNNRS